ncbi:MAG TPA: MarR family winged helix-turn-helix transcriptional regulator [Gemmatimonadales bacterium]|jgi:DNA-binding MarR family transcriptional regulator
MSGHDRDDVPFRLPMSADSLGLTLHALARAHRARLSALLAPHGLHVGQDLLLLAVWDEPGRRQSALAAHLGIEQPTLTRMVQRLERGGMIERRPDQHDARVSLVFPTPRSRLLESTVRRAWTTLDETMLRALGPTDAARLQRLVTTVTFGLAELE